MSYDSNQSKKSEMKKCILFLFIGLIFVGCSNEPASLGIGECVYRPGFLWTEDMGADTSYVGQSFNLFFSGFSENEQTPEAELLLCDGSGSPLDLKQTEVWANDTMLSAPRVSIPKTNGVFSLKFRSVPSPAMEEGRKDILLLLCSGTNADKCEFVGIGDVAVDQAQNTIVGRLHYAYEQRWNIGNIILTWIACALLTLFVLYFFYMRATHPKFGALRKDVYVGKETPISINFKGYWKIQIFKEKSKQSFLQRLLCGKARFIVHPDFETPLVLTPSGKNRRNIKVGLSDDYSPYSNPIGEFENSKIKIESKQIIIKIQ